MEDSPIAGPALIPRSISAADGSRQAGFSGMGSDGARPRQASRPRNPILRPSFDRFLTATPSQSESVDGVGPDAR
ncbi:hypothetical protein WJX84_006405 [Apatococcus fuscideae]